MARIEIEQGDMRSGRPVGRAGGLPRRKTPGNLSTMVPGLCFDRKRRNRWIPARHTIRSTLRGSSRDVRCLRSRWDGLAGRGRVPKPMLLKRINSTEADEGRACRATL